MKDGIRGAFVDVRGLTARNRRLPEAEEDLDPVDNVGHAVAVDVGRARLAADGGSGRREGGQVNPGSKVVRAVAVRRSRSKSHGIVPPRTGKGEPRTKLHADLHDPSKLIGQLSEPLLVPEGDERVGYVPNVVYSCGGMIHGDRLIIPYGVSDSASTFATASLSELLDALTP